MKESYSPKRIRKLQLVKELQKGNPISIEYMCSIIDCSRRSIYNYLKELKEDSLPLQEVTVESTSYYWIDSQTNQASGGNEYEELTFEHLRQFAILEKFHRRPQTRSELINQFAISPCQKTNLMLTAIDIRKSKFYSLLNDLVKIGELVEIDTPAQKDKRLFLTGNSLNHQLYLSEEDLLQMHFELSLSLNGAPYNPQLHTVYEKVCSILGIIEKENPYFQNYLQYGKKRKGKQESYANLQKVFAQPYQKKCLYIQYMTRVNSERKIVYAIGLILYCAEKDIYYLLGKEYEPLTESYVNTIIDIKSILDVTESQFPNQFYQSGEFLQMADEMFSISMAEQSEVIVSFQRTANVERKITYLHRQRKCSCISVNEDSILYRDTLRGLNDFANYLRSFGKSAIVIAPEELKELMALTVTKSLQRYEESEYERKL